MLLHAACCVLQAAYIPGGTRCTMGYYEGALKAIQRCPSTRGYYEGARKALLQVRVGFAPHSGGLRARSARSCACMRRSGALGAAPRTPCSSNAARQCTMHGNAARTIPAAARTLEPLRRLPAGRLPLHSLRRALCAPLCRSVGTHATAMRHAAQCRCSRRLCAVAARDSSPPEPSELSVALTGTS